MIEPDDCASALSCPICGSGMSGEESTISCPRSHSFDLARAGYVNLTTGSRPRRVGDTREMVAARRAFLARGHMRPLEDALAASAPAGGAPPRLIVDVGAGTGQHLERLRERFAAFGGRPPCAIGVDVSRAAAESAARAYPGCLFAVCDAEEIVPVADGAADLVLSAFAPRPAAELARITGDGATLLVAAAGERHLSALRRRFDLISVRSGKLDELVERLRPQFELLASETLEWALELSPEACREAIMMGPNAWHRDRPPEPDDGIADTASVVLGRFRRRRPPA